MKNNNLLTNSDHGLLLINRNDHEIGRTISETGNWDLEFINFLKALINKFYPANSSIEIIDAGANIGVYSLEMSKIHNFNIKVIAIEAQRLIFQMLNANIALNNLENVWTYHRIISDKNEETILLECPDLNVPANFGGYEVQKHIINSDFDGKFFMPPEEVQSITLDSLALENCALLKLDIEGMEDVALMGSISLLKKSKPIIFLEKHKTDYKKVKSILKECGYDIWELPKNNVLALRKEWDINIEDFARIVL
jgi:FkbM family methyltransferase